MFQPLLGFIFYTQNVERSTISSLSLLLSLFNLNFQAKTGFDNRRSGFHADVPPLNCILLYVSEGEILILFRTGLG